LHRAARTGHAEVVSLFTTAGADATVRNALGKTPDDEAAQGKRRTVPPQLTLAGERTPVPSAKADSAVAWANDGVECEAHTE
ncbi:MAG: ankyrin repeat domain-containing protein, partial [Planctomycetes bacterium]|nr:ankyrin repeat domain-containing protein [Planctomycetota bacterium]